MKTNATKQEVKKPGWAVRVADGGGGRKGAGADREVTGAEME